MSPRRPGCGGVEGIERDRHRLAVGDRERHEHHGQRNEDQRGDERAYLPGPQAGRPRFSRSRISLPVLKNGTNFRDRDMVAGARIAAGAGRALLDREGAEAAQFHPVAARQRPVISSRMALTIFSTSR